MPTVKQLIRNARQPIRNARKTAAKITHDKVIKTRYVLTRKARARLFQAQASSVKRNQTIRMKFFVTYQ